MLSIKCDLSAALGQLENIENAVQEALRPAVYRAARMVYLEAQNLAPKSKRKQHQFYSRDLTSGGEEVQIKRGDRAGKIVSRYVYSSGDLRKSIYIKHADDKSMPGLRETYVISWRKNSSALGYVPYAHMVEYGTVRVPPNPFVRPAYDAKKVQAEQLIIDTIKKAVAQA